MSEEDKIGTSESFEGLKISKRENEIGNFAEPEESFSFIHMQRILTERLDRGNVGRRSLLQQRFVTCVIGMILLCNVYALSTLVCFSQTDLDYTYSDIEAVNSSCPGPPVNLTSEELTLLTEGTLYWVKNHSIIVNSYFIGYSLTQIPGGLIAERIGGKHVVAISLLFSSLLTVTTPAIVKKFHEDGAIVTRFLLGCFIGPMIPALCVVVAHWAPPDERGRIITIVFCVCAVIIYNDPAVNPFISPYEKQFLKDHLRRFVKRNKYLPSTPIFEILGCVPVWGLVFAHISYAVLFNQYEFFLPIYLRNYQKISQYSSHLFHYITSVAIIIVAVLSGWLADILLLNDALSIEKLRKSYAATGK
ncbi:sodium-dependent phosphate transport protein 3-like [Lycorma delicatula]|uniref:sodium-dependent phosphate transport protein 3-like n=1 Tax=Lycorma delicatula TaxID=130591 RepID=UPI003F516248